MKDDAIMKKTRKTETKIDWSAANAVTEAERLAAALADPDNKPMSDKECGS